MTHWQRWISQPQTVWLRKVIFQIHLWSGIGFGLYVFLVSVTGSVVVYRNELYVAATREPMVVAGSGPQLTDEQLKAAAARAYPGYVARTVNRGAKPNQAVSIYLSIPPDLVGKHGSEHKSRLFHPYTGADLGDSVPLGIFLVSKLLELHDDLLGGATGRLVNGAGAVLVIVISLTGIVVWWPGIRTWRRSLTVPRSAKGPRLIWSLHGVIGFWSLAFILIFGLSGVYLSNPEFVQNLADRIEPLTDANVTTRVGDRIIYWLAYLHFGRINGIGIPCKGPGVCDQTVKFIWALFGLAPAAMFVTGAMMWWNRVARRKLRRVGNG